MGNINYKAEILGYKEDLRLCNYSYMRLNDDEIDICNKISLKRAPVYLGRKVNVNELKPHFIKTISLFGDKIIDFYEKYGSDIKIERNKQFNNGELLLEGNRKDQRVIMTLKQLRQVDLVGYCHELGHLPTMLKPHKNEYYEYSEVFPMFVEYLAQYLIEPKDFRKIMKEVRLEPTKKSAIYYLQNEQNIKNNNSNKARYLKFEQRECMKYIRSLDLTLQLIKLYQTNRSAVISEFEKYVYSEKSMKEISQTFGVKTDGCTNVLKLIR